MNETRNRKKNGVALAGVATVALAGGYLLRGAGVGAQTAGDKAQAPLVQTAATRDAVAIQKAFNQVSNAVEPAVVTITTERSGPRPASGRSPGPFSPGPFKGPGGPSGPGSGRDPFEEFFRQFERNFGFRPNALQREDLRRQFRQGQLREVQSGPEGGGLGSGMIIRQDGLILTNAHVVEGASKTGVTVKLADSDRGPGREFKRAKVLGVDERTDVAVLKINATNLPVVKMGDSNLVRVGDWAVAVGNPFALEHTVTVGVISARAREVPLSQRNSDYLQTDASINPGNSGGPLCDINGRVIGVNNAIYSQSGGNVGIGFAIPINTARDIANELIKSGKITRGYLGVGIKSLDENGARELGLPANTRGVLVSDVSPNTPGAKAGLQPGDVIQAFNGQAVTKSSELQKLVGGAPVGSTVRLQVLRDGGTITLSAVLTELTNQDKGPTSPAPVPENQGGDEGRGIAPSALGLRLRPLTPQAARRYGVEGVRGVLVAGVVEGSPAAEAGLRAGDVIERVGQKTVTTPAEYQAAVRGILNRYGPDDTKSVALRVNRKGERAWVSVVSQR